MVMAFHSHDADRKPIPTLLLEGNVMWHPSRHYFVWQEYPRQDPEKREYISIHTEKSAQ